MPTPFENKLGYILVGLPGSGKSTVAKKIQEKYPNAPILSSDSIREELFGTTRFDEAGDEEIQRQSKIAYTVLYERAVELMKNDERVILDATHVQTTKRLEALRYLLENVSVEILTYIIVNTPHTIIEQRMKEKAGMANDNETFYEGWKRVFEYFLEKEARGELSWPTEEEGIEIVRYTELSKVLR